MPMPRWPETHHSNGCRNQEWQQEGPPGGRRLMLQYVNRGFLQSLNIWPLIVSYQLCDLELGDLTSPFLPIKWDNHCRIMEKINVYVKRLEQNSTNTFNLFYFYSYLQSRHIVSLGGWDVASTEEKRLLLTKLTRFPSTSSISFY